MVDVELTINWIELPAGVVDFLREADSRVSEFVRHTPKSPHGFVPSDFVSIYHALRTIADTNLACGNSFCEWGSGFGVVASLAALLGFHAYGIELDRDLFDESRDLAEDFEIPVEIVNGSFVPENADKLVDQAFTHIDGEFSLDTQADDAYSQLGLEIEDFDVVFAYPWPNDEELTVNIFERFAGDGALLLTYNDLNSIRLRRK